MVLTRTLKQKNRQRKLLTTKNLELTTIKPKTMMTTKTSTSTSAPSMVLTRMVAIVGLGTVGLVGLGWIALGWVGGGVSDPIIHINLCFLALVATNLIHGSSGSGLLLLGQKVLLTF